jgi:hypothetical protein
MARIRKNQAEAVEVETPETEVEAPTTAPTKAEYVNPIVKAGFDLDTLREQYTTKSAVIRFLGQRGYATKDIAKFMDIRYQHARNVLTQKMKSKTEEPKVEASTSESE